MTHQQEKAHTGLLRLTVVGEADPSMLTRVLGLFQNLNVTPGRVVAEMTPESLMVLTIDVSDMPEARFDLIAAKVSQMPSVLEARSTRS